MKKTAQIIITLLVLAIVIWFLITVANGAIREQQVPQQKPQPIQHVQAMISTRTQTFYIDVKYAESVDIFGFKRIKVVEENGNEWNVDTTQIVFNSKSVVLSEIINNN